MIKNSWFIFVKYSIITFGTFFGTVRMFLYRGKEKKIFYSMQLWDRSGGSTNLHHVNTLLMAFKTLEGWLHFIPVLSNSCLVTGQHFNIVNVLLCYNKSNVVITGLLGVETTDCMFKVALLPLNHLLRLLSS